MPRSKYFIIMVNQLIWNWLQIYVTEYWSFEESIVIHSSYTKPFAPHNVYQGGLANPPLRNTNKFGDWHGTDAWNIGDHYSQLCDTMPSH